MAFHVCYSKAVPDDHCRQTAFYLEQNFYPLIFQHCLKNRSHFAVLSVIASLRYKSPVVVLDNKDLDRLMNELSSL